MMIQEGIVLLFGLLYLGCNACPTPAEMQEPINLDEVVSFGGESAVSTTFSEPLKWWTDVRVQPDGVLVNRMPVVGLTQEGGEWLYEGVLRGHLIPSLFERMLDSRYQTIDGYFYPSNGEFYGDYGLHVDKQVPFGVLRKVFYTAAQAGYDRPRLVALTADRINYRTLLIGRRPDPYGQAVPDLVVVVDDEGFLWGRVEDGTETRINCRPELCLWDHAYPVEALAEDMRGQSGTVLLSPDDAVSFQAVVYALDAITMSVETTESVWLPYW